MAIASCEVAAYTAAL